MLKKIYKKTGRWCRKTQSSFLLFVGSVFASEMNKMSQCISIIRNHDLTKKSSFAIIYNDFNLKQLFRIRSSGPLFFIQK